MKQVVSVMPAAYFLQLHDYLKMPCGRMMCNGDLVIIIYNIHFKILLQRMLYAYFYFILPSYSNFIYTLFRLMPQLVSRCSVKILRDFREKAF